MSIKMTRMQLKAIVKECLVEILQEGLGGIASPQMTTSINLPMSESRRPQPTPTKKTQKISPLDMPAYPQAQGGNKRSPSPSLAEAIRNEARGNPVMADILADTAMTTLPKMMSSGDLTTESSSRSKITQQEQFAGTPEQVFGEDVTSKWANLAFMDAPSKKIM